MGSLFVGYGKMSQNKKDSVVIIPFNPTGYHWIFIQIYLRNRHYYIIDLLRDDIDEGSKTFVKTLLL